MHAAKHDQAEARRRRKVKKDRDRRIREMEADLVALDAKSRALARVFTPCPETDEMAARIAATRRITAKALEALKRRAAAALIAGLLTLPAWFPATSPTPDSSLTPAAPHDAGKGPDTPAVRDDRGAGFSAWL